MYTPGTTSELLSIPSSTLRRYAVLYAPFLSSGARQRRRSYNQSDLTTLTRIQKLLTEGTLIKDIPPILESELGKTIDQDQNESKALTLPGLIVQLQDMQAAFDNQAAQIDQLQKRLAWIEQPFYKRIGRTPPA